VKPFKEKAKAIISCRDVIGGGASRGAFAPALILKKRDFCVFAHTILFFSYFASPLGSWSKFPHPLEKTEMTSLISCTYILYSHGLRLT